MAVDNCGNEICVGTSGPFTVDGTTPATNLQVDPSCPSIPADVVDISTWQLTNTDDSCIINQYVSESLIIGGADFNVYKLLGVHEQELLTDVTGNGTAISNGDLPGFPAAYAFTTGITEWRSIQKGTNVPASAFIGYDFGIVKRLDGSNRMYGIEANVRKQISSFSIKQSANAQNRVTTARLERSDNGSDWFGVGVVQLPDNDCLNTVYLKDSVPMRYWRLRPTSFNGGTIDYWGVQAFEMFKYDATQINNIQDKIFVENRDRAYSTDSILIKGTYTLVDIGTELSQWGINLPSDLMACIFNFLAVVAVLGRPLVIGDIIEVPSKAQYSAELRRIQKWMEVTDVAWSSQGYTPGWFPTLISVTMQPAFVTQETQDIFGDLAREPVPNELGLVSRDNGQDKFFQDYFDMSQTSHSLAKDEVPEAGAEGSGTIRQWETSELTNAAAQNIPNLQKTGLAPNSLYVEDAMPPNNQPFTEGNTLPVSGLVNGAYHRLTYTGLSAGIPPRLYRYSTIKGGWQYLETDKRQVFNPVKPTLQEYLISPTKKPTSKITT